MKIAIVIGGFMMPTYVDDKKIKYQSALMLEDENQTYRCIIGIDRDEKLSKPYMPYCTRSMSLEKAIEFRDALTKCIEEWKKIE